MHVLLGLGLILENVQGQPGMVRPPPSPQLLDATETVETIWARLLQDPPHHVDIVCTVHQ